MSIEMIRASAARDFPFLFTRQLFTENCRNLLTEPYDEQRGWHTRVISQDPVHCFWSGPAVNDIGILGLSSILKQGHAVSLYTYNNIEEMQQNVPHGVIVKDASEVLPKELYELSLARSEVRYFSDIFRYAALYQYGGWWVDMDIILVKPLQSVGDYLFCSQWSGWENGHLLVGDVIKAPQYSAHMRNLYEESLQRLCSDNYLAYGDVGPRLLTEYIFLQHPELARFIVSPTVFNTIDWTELHLLHKQSDVAWELVADPRVIGIHFWNKMWAQQNVLLSDAEGGSIANYLVQLVHSPNRLTDLAHAFHSDKGRAYHGDLAHCYTRVYHQLLHTKVLEPIRIMQLGLCQGLLAAGQHADIPSLRIWLEYFPNGFVYGASSQDFSGLNPPRTRIFQVDQSSEDRLDASLCNLLNEPLDVIIDASSRASWDQQVTFKKLFPRLRPGGLYIIENHDQQSDQLMPYPTIKTGQLLATFVSTGNLKSNAIPDTVGIKLANQISKVSFFDSFLGLIKQGETKGLIVIEKSK